MALLKEIAELPDLEALGRCLSLLSERAQEVGTLELHDPIYLMQRDRDPAQLLELWNAMKLYTGHPAVPQIRNILAPWLPKVEHDLASVLRQDSPIPEGVDPLEELARRLNQSRRVRVMLEERVEGLEERLSLWVRTANILSAVGALVAVVAIVGWLAALGALSIPWLDSPTVEMDGEQSDGMPETTGAEGSGEGRP